MDEMTESVNKIMEIDRQETLPEFIDEAQEDATLEDTAINFELKKTKNVVDLDEIDIKSKVKLYKGINKQNEPYEYYYILIDDIRYRIPISVIIQIKELIAEFPEVSKFKITATGSGIDTKYFVEEK